MSKQATRDEVRKRIHVRIRKKVRGTTERPRLAIFRSINHIFAQVIDDDQGVTLAAASSLDKGTGLGRGTGGNLAGAKVVGAEIAKRARAKGIESVVCDRGGYPYHGRVKALADAAREAGLKF